MSNRHMLVVEDDPYAQQVAAIILQHHHISTDIAKSAEEGLDLLAANDYNAAMIDLALPGMDGWALLQAIRSNPHTAHLPCIAVTAYHSGSVAQKAIQAGFTAYLNKPLAIGLLAQELQRLLS
jgi:CheY-like chemotaxis protein